MLSFFIVCGLVDGEPVEAVYDDGRLLLDPSLLDRAQLVVALGDTFADTAEHDQLVANLLGDPVTMLLTVLRACDQPLSVELGAASTAVVARVSIPSSSWR